MNFTGKQPLHLELVAMQQDNGQLLQKVENLNEEIDKYKKQIEDISREKTYLIISNTSSSRESIGDPPEELARALLNMDLRRHLN